MLFNKDVIKLLETGVWNSGHGWNKYSRKILNFISSNVVRKLPLEKSWFRVSTSIVQDSIHRTILQRLHFFKCFTINWTAKSKYTDGFNCDILTFQQVLFVKETLITRCITITCISEKTGTYSGACDEVGCGCQNKDTKLKMKMTRKTIISTFLIWGWILQACEIAQEEV